MNLNKLILLMVMLLGVVASFFLGSLVAGGDYFKLAIIAGAVCGTAYMLFLSTGWIYIGFLWICTYFTMRPLGFAINPLDWAVFLAAIYVFMIWWRKGAFEQTAISRSFTPFAISVVVLLLYSGVHFLFNKASPVNSEHIALTNAAKQYLAMMGGFLLIAVAAVLPRGCWRPKNPVLLLAAALLVGTLVNLLIRSYGIFVLGVGEVDPITGTETQAVTFNIPILNLTDNVFALRGLSSACTLLAIVMLTSRSAQLKTSGARVLAWSLILLGICGALLGSGRASLFLAVVQPLAVLILRKRYAMVLLVLVAAVLLIGLARFAYEIDDRLVPGGVQRSLAMIPGMQMEAAKASIDSSSNWRMELFQRALEEWQQSWRTILTGRCVFAFTERDAERLAGTDIYTYQMVSALRRGATHNLATDLLLTVGMAGFILYFAAYGALVWGLHRVRAMIPRDDPAEDLRLIGMVASVVGLVSLVGGSFFSPLWAMIIAALVGAQVPRDRETVATSNAMVPLPCRAAPHSA